MIKIILLDIDGTLTNSEKKITPKTRDALLKAQEEGCQLVLASGRPTKGLDRYVKELEMDKHNGLLISYNGAMVSNAETKEHYFENLMDPTRAKDLLHHLEQFKEAVPILEEYGLVISKDCFNNTIKYKGEDFNVLKYEARMNNCIIREVEDFDEYLDHKTPKVLVYGAPEYLRANYMKMKEGFEDLNSMFSAEFYYEFTNKGIDKTFAIKEVLVNKLGFKQEEMIAFGDAGNDISMVSFAGIGVAMGNAMEELKEVADYITDDNDHDGIASALEKYL